MGGKFHSTSALLLTPLDVRMQSFVRRKIFVWRIRAGQVEVIETDWPRQVHTHAKGGIVLITFYDWINTGGLLEIFTGENPLVV